MKWTNEQLIEAVKQAFSCREVIKMLGLKPAGGNYKTIKKSIANLNLDTSHWLGCGWLKGKTHNFNLGKSLHEILTENSSRQSYGLKKRLLKANMIDNKCSQCGINEWQGQKLSLHLDHINGNNTDNRIENLRLLCPNCHSLTDTYCGKNKALLANKNIQ